MVAGLWTAIPSAGRTASLANIPGNNSDRSQELATLDQKVGQPNHRLMAQLFYPTASDRQALMVLGQGQVKVPADTARIDLLISRGSESAPTAEGTTFLPNGNYRSEMRSPTTLSNKDSGSIPLTKSSLKPIIDALVAIGVPDRSIEVKTNNSSPFSPSSSDTAKIIVKLEKPTRDRVEKIVTTANEAAKKNGKLYIDSVAVKYAVNECQALVASAYQAAVKDARNRAQALATAMGVEISNVPSVAESPFGDLFSPVCSEESTDISSLFPFGSFSSSYDPTAPAEVQMRRDIFVTYPIK
jgi:uncharacterized protein YggE